MAIALGAALRARDCVPMHGRVRACSRSTAQQTGTTAVGLELGSHDGLDGTIGFDGEHSCGSGNWRDRMPRAQLSSRARRTTASPRGSASRSAPGRRHPPRYRFRWASDYWFAREGIARRPSPPRSLRLIRGLASHDPKRRPNAGPTRAPACSSAASTASSRSCGWSPLRSSDARRPDKQRDRRGHQQRAIALRANQ